MSMHLTVTQPFDNRVRGDQITDAEEVAAVLKSHPHSVVQHFAHDAKFGMTDGELAEKEAPAAKAPAPVAAKPAALFPSSTAKE